MTQVTTDLIQEVQEIAQRLDLRDGDVALMVAANIQQNRILSEQKKASSNFMADLIEVASSFYHSAKSKPDMRTGTSNETDVTVE